MEYTNNGNVRINLSEEEIVKLYNDYVSKQSTPNPEQDKLFEEASEHIIQEVYSRLGISKEYMQEQLELIKTLKAHSKGSQDESFTADFEKQKQAVLGASGSKKEAQNDAIEAGIEIAAEVGKATVIALGGMEIVAPAVLGASAYASVAAVVAGITASPLFGPAVLACSVGYLIHKITKKAKAKKANEAIEAKGINELEEDFQKMLEQLEKIKNLLERDKEYILEQYDLFKSGALTKEDFDNIVKDYTSNILAELDIKAPTSRKVNARMRAVRPAGKSPKRYRRKVTTPVIENPKAPTPEKSETDVKSNETVNARPTEKEPTLGEATVEELER